jgi:SAM-dependent methyltransferase
MSDANREQVAFWNGAAGKRWATHQETLDRVWKSLGDAALNRAAVKSGERVVDVGCGCGATALELAAKVGPSGFVLGVDISAPMLGRARERAHDLAISNIQFVESDASTYPFGGDADLVFSRVGVMFFSDPAAGFANLRRALRPGGRLVFVCFRDRQLNSWWTVPLAAAATILPPDAPTPPNEPGPFSLSDEVRLQTILDAAGFVGTICEPVEHDIVIGSEPDSATDFCLNAGPAARVIAGASDEARIRVWRTIRESLLRYSGSAGVSLRAATWVIHARTSV